MPRHVVFVAPYFGENLNHCLRQLCKVPGAKVGIITREPSERVPKDLPIAGHYQVDNPLDAGQLTVATRAFQKEWGEVDRLIGYLEQLQLPLAEARDRLDLPGMRASVARNFRDKNEMKRVLGEAGQPVARQKLIHSADDARAFVEEVGYPIIVKPLAGVGTQNTMRISEEAELYPALNKLLPSRTNPAQAEEFVTGDEHTFESVSIDGEVVWSSSTYYLPGPLQVLENPWMKYCVLLPREMDEPHAEGFRRTNHAALAALGMRTGLSHMEWFHRKDGSNVISEVGARPPGVNIMGMMGQAHDTDFWSKWCHLMVHHEFDLPERRYACGCAFLRGHGPGRAVARVEGLKEVLAELGDKVTEGRTPKVGMPRSSHYEGEGWLLVREERTEDVVKALKRIIEGVQITYA